MNIYVDIDKKSGVCGGVRRATNMIEEQLSSPCMNKDVFVNGELLHNRLEMERLVKKGLKVEEDISKIKNSHIFFRAHGVGKKAKETAENNNNIITDATCPKVSRSQRIIEEFFLKDYQIVIVGKVMHPEVKGLLGYCDNKGICLMDESDLEKIDYSRKTLLIAQTTVSTAKYKYYTDILRKKIENLEVADTICSFVEKREIELIEFANKYDIVIFIGGTNSSNTKVMFEKLISCNKRSYLIENRDEIDFSWFKDEDKVGISGSASTPAWQIEEIKEVIDNHFK